MSYASRTQNHHAYADTLPFREIVTVREQYPEQRNAWHVETLECGHENVACYTGYSRPKRRRCWQCGPKGDK